MELMCLEKMMECKQSALLDPAIFNDPRVLDNLLHLESVYVLARPYFGNIQPQIQPFMRKIVTTWMLEVCEEQCCEEQVFPLAVNFLDRFLAACEIKACHLQLSAAACLLLASKVRMSVPLSVTLLAFYTDQSVTTSQIKEWEMLLLSKLCWEVCGVTGFDFIDHLLHNLHFSTTSNLLRPHTLTLLALSYTEPDLICIKGSVLSCAALIGAARGLKLKPDVLSDACLLTKTDPALVESVVSRVELALEEEAVHQTYTQVGLHYM